VNQTHVEVDANNVLVTGAGSPVGRAVSVHLARAGVRVFLTSRTEDNLAATVERLARDELHAGGAMTADLGDVGSAQGVVASWRDTWEDGDDPVVVHCAFGHIGEDEGTSLGELEPGAIVQFLGDSVQAAWNTAWALSRLDRPIRVIFVGADWGVPTHNVLTPGEGVGSELYVSAKYAITGLATALDRQSTLRCTVIAPGAIYTESPSGDPIDIDDPIPEPDEEDFVSLGDVARACALAVETTGTAKLVLLKPARHSYDGVS
jgi:NAD(P)-dependent dehydrogenase (short-subunit alcohol dehydrogenase family)